MEEIFRKYIRYSLNEKPFTPDLIAYLIQLRKASLLTDSEVAGLLNEISRRIVQDKGIGFTGFLANHSLFLSLNDLLYVLLV